MKRDAQPPDRPLSSPRYAGCRRKFFAPCKIWGSYPMNRENGPDGPGEKRKFSAGAGRWGPGFIVHEIAADVTVRVAGEMPNLPPDVDAEVEHLWQQAIRRVAEGGAGRLFNGRVFSADHISAHAIT